MSDKEELVSVLNQCEAEISDILPRLNSIDAILTLMSYLEILDNEHNHLGRMAAQFGGHMDTNDLIMQRNMIQNIQITKECIFHIFKISNQRKTLSKIPSVESFFTLNSPDDPSFMKSIMEKFNPNADLILSMSIQLAAHITGYRILIWKGLQQIAGKEQVPLALEFLRLYNKKKSIKSLLDNNIPSSVSSDGEDIRPDISLDEILKRENVSLRHMLSSTPDRYPFWTNNMLEAGMEGIRSTELDMNSPKQRKALEHEHRTFFKEFDAVPGFTELFMHRTGISLSDYCEITLALSKLPMRYEPPVLYLPKAKVVEKVQRQHACTEEHILKVLDLFTFKKGDDENRVILYDGQNYIYTWNLIAVPFRHYVENIFHESIDGDFKGKAFEKECRMVLAKHCHTVLPDRLLVNQQIIPDVISMRLWGKVKRRTDFDVLAVKESCLILVECKSEVQRLKRRESQLNSFAKYYEELLSKSQWVAGNFQRFRQLVENEKYNIPAGVRWVIPLLAGAFIEPYEHPHIFSIREIDEIVGKLPSTFSGSEISMRLDSSTDIALPFFGVVNE